MTYNPKHLRSIQALPDNRRVTIFLNRDVYFIESLLNPCEVLINSIAMEIDSRVRPIGELIVGENFWDELRTSSTAYFQGYSPDTTGGDLVATFNSWSVFMDTNYRKTDRLPFVGPDGAYFLILATSGHPDHQVLLGSINFVLRGKK